MPAQALSLAFDLVRPPTAEDAGHVRINGVDHHITLISVKGTGPDQQAVEPDDTQLQALQDFEDSGPGFMPIQFGSAPYLCIITPFCD